MKNILFLLWLLTRFAAFVNAQSYTRTGYQQYWQAGSYLDTVRTVVEYNGPIGQGLAVSSSKDTIDNGSWLPVQKDFITGYATDSFVVISKLWNQTASTFDNYRKVRSNFQPGTILVQNSLEQYWIGNLWENATKIEVQYDANNFKIGVLNSIWAGGAWVTPTRVQYSNNAAGKPIATTEDSLKGGNWVTYQIDSAQYDVNGNKTEQLTLFKIFNLMTRTAKKLFYYGTGNQLTSAIHYSLIGDLAFPLTKTTYTDAGGDNLVNNEFQFNNVFPPADPVWINLFRFIWGPSVNSVAENTTDNSIYLYPNPSQDFIRFAGIKGQPLIRIFGADGREMIADRFTGDISVSGLPTGLYVAEIPSLGLSKRFVKE